MTTRQALRFYVELLRPQRRLLAFAVLAASVKALMESPIPKATGYLVDRLGRGDLAWFQGHWPWLVIALAGFSAVYLPVTYASTYFPSMVAFRAFFILRVRLFDHLQGLSADFFLRSKTGDLTTRLVGDIQSVSATAVGVITRVAFDAFLFVPSLYFMIRTSWAMTLVVLGYAGIQLFFIRRMMPSVRRRSQDIANKMGEISSEATEKLSGIDLVRSMARERDVSRHFANLNADHLYLSTKLLRYSQTRSVLIHGHNAYMPIIIALIAFPLARFGGLSPGDIVAVILYMPVVTGPLFRFSEALMEWAVAMGAMGRVTEVFDALPSVKDKPKARIMDRPKGSIVFDHVSFMYPAIVKEDPPTPVIADFSLDVQPGQTVAFVGPSGSGKTTLAQLLLRFYDVTGGSIRIDGVDIRDVTQASLRRAIGIVMQTSIIFSGTIRDNLRLGRPKASDAEIWNALRSAQLDDFVLTLPDGLGAVLGERGVNLSGGQKQRLCIARTFLMNPSILVLDEATSALDSKSEAGIQEALDRLMVSRTTIAIAHRLSTIRDADNIVVLDRGRIQETGRHEDLMSRQGAYYELVKAQTEIATP